MVKVRKSFCRCCINQCAIEVVFEDGKILAVQGDVDNPQYKGYSCIKGRSQAEYLRDAKRLLRPLRRRPDGSHEEVSSDAALNEIAEKLVRIRDKFGPRAIAGYWGTMATVGNPGMGMPFYYALMDAIGSDMRFDPNTIDKGGKQTAQSFLGYWQAPSRGFDRPQAILLIGINPLLTYTGFPAGSPKRWLADQLEMGCKLIVIDPRATQVAERATHFLQVKPGHDAQVLAAMLKIILDEELYDRAFVSMHVANFNLLSETLAALDVTQIAENAGISSDLIADAARAYANAPRGYAMAGTGPHMTGRGTLIEYLTLVIETVCGRWMRAGETVLPSASLLPKSVAKAQANPPDADWALAGRMRVRGLKQTRAGMPTAALADEILLPGTGQIKALISWGGNPAVVFPDQAKTLEALKSLELFIQIDPWYSESAKLADYVLAPTMALEVETVTLLMDWLSGRATGYGQGLAHAQHTPAIVSRPPGSDLLEDWEMFYELIARMGYAVEVRPFGHTAERAKLRFDTRPTSSELLNRLCEGSRIPLDTIKAHGQGRIYDDDLIVVQSADPGHSGRLDIGSSEMMECLKEVIATPPLPSDARFPFRLLCRRANHVYNSSYNTGTTNKGQAYNPAFMHPADMAELGIDEEAEVVIASEHGRIRAVAHADVHLRRQTVSMSHAFGAAEQPGGDPATYGSNPNRLIPTDRMYDLYTGQPRMTNVPVSIVAAVALAAKEPLDQGSG